MTAYLVPLVLIGGLTSAGVYLLLERSLTRMLLGLLLIGNAVNLLILPSAARRATRRCAAAPATARPPPPIRWRRA